MWANDYPHHEGSWPHSAAAIERTMGDLTDAERARILGLNAAELFGFTVPASMRERATDANAIAGPWDMVHTTLHVPAVRLSFAVRPLLEPPS